MTFLLIFILIYIPEWDQKGQSPTNCPWPEACFFYATGHKNMLGLPTGVGHKCKH